ncbi:MAG: two-component system response regulator [Desulfuromonas sp.]|nr:MAG: two-component system response regulator [Desulfuromonas sp.]
MSKHVVVIDDNRFILTVAKDILTNAGFQVSVDECAINANQHIFGEKRPDVILLDVMMPLIKGDQKLRNLKNYDLSRDIPIILMSSRPEDELKQIAADSGADGFLCKPFDEKSLVAAINSQLES